MNVNKFNIYSLVYGYILGQKLYDYINGYKEGFRESLIFFFFKSLKNLGVEGI